MSVFNARMLFLWQRSTEWARGIGKSQPGHRLYHKNRTPISPEKQAKLDKLCEQLLKKQELITSGKIQFLSLAKIKKRLGKRWIGLSKIVYETAEEVISGYLDGQKDFFLRYKDEVYFLFFLNSDTEEGRRKATAIADEIRRRLFELGEKELRDLEIRESIGIMDKSYLKDGDLYAFLDAFEQDNLPSPPFAEEREPLPDIPCIEISAKDYRPTGSPPEAASLPVDTLHFSYLPLWDVKRGALTTYLCLSHATERYDNIFEAQKILYNDASPEEQVALDIAVLRRVILDLKALQRNTNKFLIACPVQYATLHRFESYELYKQVLQEIPVEQRSFLILYVMDIGRKLPLDDAYWFIKPVKEFCRMCFAEVPLRNDLNFNYMRNLGVDAVGFRIGDMGVTKPETLQMISRFSYRAKALHIPMTFIFELSQISLATSSIFTEYDYVGGEAIHGKVARPDRMLRFRSEDLLIRLIKQKA